MKVLSFKERQEKKYIITVVARIHITLCVIFKILVSLENVTKYTHVVAQLPQRLKSTLFEIFSNGGCPKGTWIECRKNFEQR